MRTRWIFAAALAAMGLIWIGQGLGLLGRSGFMDNDVRWAMAGGALLVGGLVLGWTALRRRSQP